MNVEIPENTLSPKHFMRYSLKESRDRNRCLEQMYVFLEDICESENKLGNGLQKCALIGKFDKGPEITALLESMGKSTANSGKHLVNHASSVSVNVSKAFPEMSRSNGKKLGNFALKTQNQLTELHKAKKNYQKALERYTKSVQDAENALKTRDSSGPTSLESASGEHSLSKRMSMYTKGGTASGAETRCLEALKEVEAAELNAHSAWQKLSNMYNEYDLDARATFRELDVMEQQRILCIQDFLEKFILSGELFLNRGMEGIDLTEKAIAKASLDLDIAAFCSLLKSVEVETIDKGVGVGAKDDIRDDISTTSETSVTDAPPAVTNLNDSLRRSEVESSVYVDIADANGNLEFRMFSRQIQVVADYEEQLKQLFGRVNHHILEYSDAQKLFLKGAYRAIDKQFSKSLTSLSPAASTYITGVIAASRLGGLGGVGGSVRAESTTNSTVVAESVTPPVSRSFEMFEGTFIKKESPSLHGVWEKFVLFYLALLEFHAGLCEQIAGKIIPAGEALVRKWENNKRDLLAKQSGINTKIDTAKRNYSKAIGKLQKVRDQLKERRHAIGKGDGSLTAGESTKESMKDAGDDVSTEGGDGFEDRNSNAAPVSGSASSASGSGLRKSGLMMQSIGKFVRGTQNKLAAVGLATAETPAERVTRIEHQIAELEAEENDCREGVASAKASLESLYEQFVGTFTMNFEVVKVSLKSDFEQLRGTARGIVEGQQNMIAVFRLHLNSLRESFGKMEIQAILAEYTNSVNTSGEYAFRTQQQSENGQSENFVEDSDIYDEIVNSLNPLSGGAGNDAMLRTMGLKQGGRTCYNEFRLLTLPAPFEPHNSELIEQERFAQRSAQKSDEALAAAIENKVDVGDGNDKCISNAMSSESTEKRKSQIFDSADPTLLTPAVGSIDAFSPPSPNSQQSASMRSLSPPKSVNRSTKAPSAQGNTIAPELAKFGLTTGDCVVESYSCAYYPKRGLLSQGRLYITQHFAAFSGWDGTKILLPLYFVRSIEKMNSLRIISNALLIKTCNLSKFRSAEGNSEANSKPVENEDAIPEGADEEYYFGSFMDRDPCYSLLTKLVEVDTRLYETSKFEMDKYATSQGLIFGSSNASIKQNSDAESVPGEPASEPDTVTVVPAPSPASSGSTSLFPKISLSQMIAPMRNKTTLKESEKAPVTSVGSTTESGGSRSSSEGASTVTDEVFDMTRFSDDGLNLSTLFKSTGSTMLAEEKISVPLRKVWNQCWRKTIDYADFLTEQGDFDVKINEWKPHTNPQGAIGASFPEDCMKLSWGFTRKGDFLHPRTSMLMFGPKNALNAHTMYLYITDQYGAHGPSGAITAEASEEWLNQVKPVKIVCVAISGFDSIPMADVFKCVQYWTMEIPKNASGEYEFQNTHLRIGLYVHFLKFSLLKSQIATGCQQEISVTAVKYIQYCQSRCSGAATVKKSITASEASHVPAVSTSATSRDELTASNELVISLKADIHNLKLMVSGLILIVIFLLIVIYFRDRSHSSELLERLSAIEKKIR